MKKKKTNCCSSVRDIVNEHVEASKKFRKEIKKNPKLAMEMLIKAGILDKNGNPNYLYYPNTD